jgi:hypothetical protein
VDAPAQHGVADQVFGVCEVGDIINGGQDGKAGGQAAAEKE